MKYSCLPMFPLVIFGIIEPALLSWAYVSGMLDPVNFFAIQAPNAPRAPTGFSPQAESLSYQMINIFLLLAFLALICCWTTHARTTKLYLFVVAIADLGHIFAVYKGVGPEYFFNYREWNDMTWGNVGVSVVLNILRWSTLVGAFGRVRVDKDGWKRE